MSAPEKVECPYCQTIVRRTAICEHCGKDIAKAIELQDEIVRLKFQIQESQRKNEPASIGQPETSRYFSYVAMAYLLVLGTGQTILLKHAVVLVLPYSVLLSFLFLIAVLRYKLQKNIWILATYVMILPVCYLIAFFSGELFEYVEHADIIFYQAITNLIFIAFLFLKLCLRDRASGVSDIYSFEVFEQYFQGPLKITENVSKLIPLGLLLLLLIKFFFK